jgi:signal transduction histidine kinase
MRTQTDLKIQLGFAIAVGVLLLTSAASFWSIRGLSLQTTRVEHTYQVLQEVESITAVLKDAQAGMRGYLLTGDTAYLRPYSLASGQLPNSLKRVDELTIDNTQQQQRMDTLSRLVEQEFRILRPLVDYQASMDRAAMRTLLDTDRQTMKQVRMVYNRIRNNELELLAQRSATQEIFEKATPIAVLVSAVLAVIIVVGLVRKVVRELADNRRLQAELAAVNANVEQRIASIRELAEQVVRGDYTVKISDAEKDNLGSLATLLNRMTQTLHDSFGALEKRNKELDQFAYVASHDLKAPLRGVSTIVKWIEDELATELSPQMRVYLDQMKGRLSRLDDLINGLLAYARAGRTNQQHEQVDVAELLHDVSDLVVPPDFELRIGPDMPTFVTDRLSLQQVFTNLLSNAVKYHHTGRGHLAVTCADVGSYYQFRVQDDGPGIAPEYHQKIFLLFQTLRDRHTAESTGIGLSIVKKIIDEQKGTIQVESAVGQGAAFLFTWPKN